MPYPCRTGPSTHGGCDVAGVGGACDGPGYDTSERVSARPGLDRFGNDSHGDRRASDDGNAGVTDGALPVGSPVAGRSRCGRYLPPSVTSTSCVPVAVPDRSRRLSGSSSVTSARTSVSETTEHAIAETPPVHRGRPARCDVGNGQFRVHRSCEPGCLLDGRFEPVIVADSHRESHTSCWPEPRYQVAPRRRSPRPAGVATGDGVG